MRSRRQQKAEVRTGDTFVYPEDVPRRPPRTVWGIRLGMRRVYFGVAASGCASVLKLSRRSFDVWRSGEPVTLQGVFFPPPTQRPAAASISTRSPVIGAGGGRQSAVHRAETSELQNLSPSPPSPVGV